MEFEVIIKLKEEYVKECVNQKNNKYLKWCCNI